MKSRARATGHPWLIPGPMGLMTVNPVLSHRVPRSGAGAAESDSEEFDLVGKCHVDFAPTKLSSGEYGIRTRGLGGRSPRPLRRLLARSAVVVHAKTVNVRNR